MSENACGGANSGKSSFGKEFLCPTCGDAFNSHWGRVQHRRRGHGEDVPRYPRLADKNWMYQKYWGELLTSKEIADIVGCSEATPRDWLQKHGIPLRSRQRPNVVSKGISNRTIEILEGELLGDGNIRAKPKEPLSASFRYGTASKQYRDWLADWLREQGYETTTASQEQSLDGYGVYDSYRLRTRQYISLARLYRRWYTADGRRVPENLRISPVMLRHWFIGDGSHSGRLALHTEGFSARCRERLIQQLAMVGIRATAQSTGELLIWKESKERFFDYMADLPKELENVYGYKWP